MHESGRLAAVQRLGLYGSPAEERFDRITKLAVRLFGVQGAIIDIVGERRLWLKSAQGLPPCAEHERSESYCQYALGEPDGCLIYDSLRDPRLVGNPHRNNVRFYAGVPIVFEGQPVGVMCIFDDLPRLMGADEMATLRDLAEMAQREFHVASLSLDSLTGVMNRGAIEAVATRALNGGALALALVDIDHFKVINDTYGHPAGDEVLRRVALRMKSATRAGDEVGRYGGEEFLLVLPGCLDSAAADVAERVRLAVASSPICWDGGSVLATASIGVAHASIPGERSLAELIKAADHALYRAKRTGRNRVELSR